MDLCNLLCLDCCTELEPEGEALPLLSATDVLFLELILPSWIAGKNADASDWLKWVFFWHRALSCCSYMDRMLQERPTFSSFFSFCSHWEEQERLWSDKHACTDCSPELELMVSVWPCVSVWLSGKRLVLAWLGLLVHCSWTGCMRAGCQYY